MTLPTSRDKLMPRSPDRAPQDQVNSELVAEIYQHQRTREQLHTVLDAVPGSISWLDTDLCYLGVNQQLANLCQIPPEQFIGQRLGFLNRRDNPFVEFAQQFFDSAHPFDRREISLGQHTFLVIAQKYNDDQAAVFIQIDITDRKNIEAQLEIANQQLANANTELAKATLIKDEMLINMNNIYAELARATKLKDDFLANMSHELRTPLNAVLGMSEALMDQLCGELNERQQQAIALINKSGQHLLDLINDVLDLSKIEAGKVNLVLHNVAPKSLINASIDMIRQLAQQKQIQIQTIIHPQVQYLQVDERRFRQALINLLSNAVKFTPEGGQVTVTVTPSDDGTETLVAVQDNGIGIAPTDMGQLFQPFVQIDSRLNRQYSGTGLGLVLVKRTIDLHHGTVSVTSEPNQGSTFTLRIPAQQNGLCSFPVPFPTPKRPIAKPIPEHTTAAIATPPRNILLADDNTLNIMLFSEYLIDEGYTVHLANNGYEALTQAQKTSPDLIIMDVQMPKMDGLTAIQELRKNTQYHSIPIIALTALAMPGDQERCLRAGATEYITKPVKLKHLGDRIRHWLTTEN
jgi:signal transduction histidine kinase